MKKLKAAVSAGALFGLGALGLVGGVAYASAPHQAQTPGATTGNAAPHAIRLEGKVQSVSTSGLVLQAGKNRTVNVSTGADTWVVVEQNNVCTSGQLSDLQTGKAIAVAGMTTTTANTVQARVVAQGSCARKMAARSAKPAARAAAGRLALAAHAAEGTVKSIDGGAITVTNAKGKDVAISTTSSTVVLSNGFTTPAALKVGDKVQVFGRPEKATGTGNNSAAPASRTLTAWVIHDVAAGTKIAVGKVQSVSGNTVTLRTPENRNGRVVTLDASTAYKLATVTNQTLSLSAASQADVKAGSNLLIEISTSQDGKTFTAKSVVILPQGKTK